MKEHTYIEHVGFLADEDARGADHAVGRIADKERGQNVMEWNSVLATTGLIPLDCLGNPGIHPGTPAGGHEKPHLKPGTGTLEKTA